MPNALRQHLPCGLFMHTGRPLNLLPPNLPLLYHGVPWVIQHTCVMWSAKCPARSYTDATSRTCLSFLARVTFDVLKRPLVTLSVCRVSAAFVDTKHIVGTG